LGRVSGGAGPGSGLTATRNWRRLEVTGAEAREEKEGAQTSRRSRAIPRAAAMRKIKKRHRLLQQPVPKFRARLFKGDEDTERPYRIVRSRSA
jgi:hypothetical protein